MALAFIDYEQQEIGIAAALSSDKRLKAAYVNGDPYVAFAIQAGAVLPDATKKSHPDIMEQFKTWLLTLNYGMQDESFACRANISVAKAKELYRMHRSIYRKYWNWISEFVDIGQLDCSVTPRYSWWIYTRDKGVRTLQNWPMQAHGAEILRLAICSCLEKGIQVIASVHDAILIEAAITDIECDVATAGWLMTVAIKYVVDLPIRIEAKIIRYPDHYTDPRVDLMWQRANGLIRPYLSHGQGC